MQNKQARKMRNFKKLKHLRMRAFFQKVMSKRIDKMNRANRARHGNSTKIMRIGIIEAIKEQISYNRRVASVRNPITTNEDTITNKNLRRAMGVSAGTNQRKRRKRIASNPSLLRGKYKKYSK